MMVDGGSMLKTFLATMITSLLLDMVWIGLIAGNFYKREVGPLMRLKESGNIDVSWPAAIGVYVLITSGIVFFVLPKVSSEQSPWAIMPWGFLFGIVLYGVYELTNYSLLKDWTIPMTFVDWAWGGVLSAIASLVAVYVSRLVS
jgi:uncharacterized membrane protein